MTRPKTVIVKKAGKATARHAKRGTVSKARREPVRSVTLMSLGGMIGAIGAWFAAKHTGSKQHPPTTTPPTLA